MKKLTLLLILLVLLLGIVFFVVHSFSLSNQQALPTASPQQSTAQTFTSPTQSPSSEVQSQSAALLKVIETQFPSSITWEQPRSTTVSYINDSFKSTQVAGLEVKGSGKVASLDNLRAEDQSYLSTNGWTRDNHIAADGPTGSIWGYKKVVDGQTQILQFGYTNTSVTAVPHQPIQSTCPCNIVYTIFVSNPF